MGFAGCWGLLGCCWLDCIEFCAVAQVSTISMPSPTNKDQLTTSPKDFPVDRSVRTREGVCLEGAGAQAVGSGSVWAWVWLGWSLDVFMDAFWQGDLKEEMGIQNNEKEDCDKYLPSL